MVAPSFLGQVGQFTGNVLGGLMGGQGFAQTRSQWPATDPQRFAQNESEQWKPLTTFSTESAYGTTPEMQTLFDTGDRQTNALMNYSEYLRQRNKDDALMLTRENAENQRRAAFEFTMPALAFKGQMGLLEAMASRPQAPIAGLAWLPDPKNQVLRHPLAG